MILGAGRDQVPIIRTAKEMGLRVIVASREGNYPGFLIADKVYMVDIRDKDSLVKIAKKEKIDGVTSCQLDLAVTSGAYIAESLNLPGIGYKCSRMFVDKYLMREQARLAGVPVPKYGKAKYIKEAIKIAQDIGYPVIIKPTDASASSGVVKVNSVNELLSQFETSKSLSSTNEVIIEDFIIGEQYSAHGFVENYNLRVLAFANKYYFKREGFLPKLTFFPALISKNLKKRMQMYYHKLIKQMKPFFGITFSEWIYKKENDTLYLTEIGMRGDGALIMSDLIPLAYGIDLQPFLINFCLNNYRTSIFDYNLLNNASAYLFFLLPEGIILQVKGLTKLSSIQGVHKSYIRSICLGEKISPLKNKGSREGPIIIKGKKREQNEETIREIRSTLKITVKTNTGPRGIIWN